MRKDSSSRSKDSGRVSVFEDKETSEFEDDLLSEDIEIDEASASELEDDLEDFESENSEEELFEEDSENDLEEEGQDFSDEYDDAGEETDSDDDQGHKNRIGEIPKEWYDEYPHIGYDVDGKKVWKPAKGDELDAFLSQMEDPDHWRTIQDPVDQTPVKLTDEEVQMISRIYRGQHADADFDPYQPSVDFFTQDKEVMPVSARPEPKSRFIPSKWEQKKVMQIVRAIRKGYIVSKKPDPKPKYYDLWGSSDSAIDNPNYIAAPKMKLPEHDESYNPPEEYLLTEQEQERWLAKDPSDRQKNYMPKKHSCLRHVAAYGTILNERFERCLDLYLCPRVKKNKLNIDPESLIPKLPDPKELKPFPTTRALSFKGHEGRIRTISIDPTGQWLVSGSDDKTVRLWEISSGRCCKQWTFDSLIRCVEWNPNRSLSIFMVAFSKSVVIIQPGIAGEDVIAKSDSALQLNAAAAAEMYEKASAKKSGCEWRFRLAEKQESQLELLHSHEVKFCVWHRRGDYLGTLCVDPNGQKGHVLVHQLSKKASQTPFKNNNIPIQSIRFHPTQPHFYVIDQRHVKIYDLANQALVTKLTPGMQHISDISIHPQGEHVLIGSYDRKVSWMDLEMGSMPYKTLRYHRMAVRQVCFHRSYPLFASASDDGTVHIFHGRVYQDLLTHPLIVPVKILRAHNVTKNDGLGVLACQFHPLQPWLISAGADHQMHLFV